MKQQLASFLLVLAVTLAAVARAQTPATPPSATTLDFATFRDRVQPILLDKRAGLARCYVCHSQGTPFRLERLGDDRRTWTEEESRKNFEAVQRLIVPGKPDASRLLLMPLAHDAGGTPFHPGGKRWTAKTDPEWKELSQWVTAASR